MSCALESAADASDEKLTAPYGMVVPISGTVEAHANHTLPPLAAFREHRGDVGAVMLDGSRLGR